MGAEDGRRDPITEELNRARRTSGRFWALQWLRIPDYAELAGGWAGLPRNGRWVVLVIIIGLIMVVPLVGIAVALLG